MEQTPNHAVIGTPEYEAQLKAAKERMQQPKPVTQPTKSAIDYWAQFFAHEKLDPKTFLDNKHVEQLIALCQKLAETGTPYDGKGFSHVAKMNARRRAVNAAMDMGFDLLAIRKRGHIRGSKPAIGRGLLDVWNEEYRERFGSTVGTPGAFEITRRKISGNIATEKQREEMAKRQAKSENV